MCGCVYANLGASIQQQDDLLSWVEALAEGKTYWSLSDWQLGDRVGHECGVAFAALE